VLPPRSIEPTWSQTKRGRSLYAQWRGTFPVKVSATFMNL
jgi:hypothetical protein